MWICTWFLKNWYKKMELEFDEIHFWSISNLNFAGCTGIKNQFWNRPKTKFVELHFLKSIIQKSSADKQGEYWEGKSMLFTKTAYCSSRTCNTYNQCSELSGIYLLWQKLKWQTISLCIFLQFAYMYCNIFQCLNWA